MASKFSRPAHLCLDTPSEWRLGYETQVARLHFSSPKPQGGQIPMGRRTACCVLWIPTQLRWPGLVLCTTARSLKDLSAPLGEAGSGPMGAAGELGVHKQTKRASRVGSDRGQDCVAEDFSEILQVGLKGYIACENLSLIYPDPDFVDAGCGMTTEGRGRTVRNKHSAQPALSPQASVSQMLGARKCRISALRRSGRMIGVLGHQYVQYYCTYIPASLRLGV